jgi:hypothetical protein
MDFIARAAARRIEADGLTDAGEAGASAPRRRAWFEEAWKPIWRKTLQISRI